MGKNRPCSFIPLCIVGEHECCYLKACCTNVHNDGKHDEDFEGWMGNLRLLCATGNLLRNVKTDLPFFVSLSLAYSFPLNVSLPIFSQLLLVCVHVCVWLCRCAVARQQASALSPHFVFSLVQSRQYPTPTSHTFKRMNSYWLKDVGRRLLREEEH